MVDHMEEVHRSIRRQKRFMLIAAALMFLAIWWLSYTAIHEVRESGGIGGWFGEQAKAFNEAQQTEEN